MSAPPSIQRCIESGNPREHGRTMQTVRPHLLTRSADRHIYTRNSVGRPNRWIGPSTRSGSAVIGSQGMGGIVAALYGAAVYLIFAATFLYAIAFVGNLP